MTVETLTERENLIYRAGWGAGCLAGMSLLGLKKDEKGFAVVRVLSDWLIGQPWSENHSQEDFQELFEKVLPQADEVFPENGVKLLLVLSGGL